MQWRASKAVKANNSKVKTLTLGDPGDLAAPPGSKPWARAVRLQIQSLLKENATGVKHLRTWLEAIEKHSGYRQLTDENGKAFSSYAEFCKAKQPWGLGYSPEIIDQILKQLESFQEKVVQVEEQKCRSWGNSQGSLERFYKLVQNCADNQPISVSIIRDTLNIVSSKAHIWRKRWLDLGWIEPVPEKKRGIYQITDEGRKQVKGWLEELPNRNYNEPLWLTIPLSNPKKAAEQLISSLETEKLKEIYELIGKTLDKQ